MRPMVRARGQPTAKHGPRYCAQSRSHCSAVIGSLMARDPLAWGERNLASTRAHAYRALCVNGRPRSTGPLANSAPRFDSGSRVLYGVFHVQRIDGPLVAVVHASRKARVLMAGTIARNVHRL
jgi:hypothetical protein